MIEYLVAGMSLLVAAVALKEACGANIKTDKSFDVYDREHTDIEKRIVEHRNLIGDHDKQITRLSNEDNKEIAILRASILNLERRINAPLPGATKKVAKGKRAKNAKR
jgi:hypothetical protein